MEAWWPQVAVLATHVQLSATGFRQKDVRFMMELLGSWRWSADERNSFPPLHNTQILRALRDLSTQDWIRPFGRRGLRYKLTRAGLVGILSSLRKVSLEAEFSTFWFLTYILQSYKAKLFQLIENEGTNLPLPQRMDVEAILDGEKLRSERRALIQKRLNYWNRRIEENHKVVSLMELRLREGKDLPSIVGEIERKYPYELNIAKPITKFIAEVPDDLKIWELTEGQKRRAQLMWQTFTRNLETEITALDQVPINPAKYQLPILK